MVAPPGRCTVIASIQQTLDLLLGKVLGDRRQAPVRHGWHTSGQIDLDLRLTQQESKERPQSRHHELSSFCALGVSVGEDVACDVRCRQLLELQCPVAELMDQKTMGNRPVVRDRRRREASLRPQIFLVLALELSQRRGVINRLGTGNNSLTLQMRNKPYGGRPLTSAEQPLFSQLLQERIDKALVELRNCGFLLLQPPPKLGHPQKLRSHCRHHIGIGSQ